MRQILTEFLLFSIPDADRVGDTYEAYPMEGDLERLQDSRGMFSLGDAPDPWPGLTQDSTLGLAESKPTCGFQNAT